MQIVDGMSKIRQKHKGTVAAVGNFDGVHLGHRTVIQEAGRIARSLNVPLSVLTFEPHPRVLFQPEGTSFRLTSRETKAEALEQLEVDLLFEVTFDHEFAQITAEEFVEKILKNKLGLRHVVCGYDFIFGHRRRGTSEMLEHMGREVGIGVTRMPAFVEEDGAVYSSTRVRQCLSEGDPKGAAELLGRPWAFSGLVEEGDKRGRTIGFPTCNLRIIQLIQPAHGVYAIEIRVETEEIWLAGVGNFGRRPTVNDRGSIFEAHIFDVDRDLYDKRLSIRVIDFIRPELKFSGIEALTAQIAADAKRARELLLD